MASYWTEHSLRFHRLFPPVKDAMYQRIAAHVAAKTTTSPATMLDFGCGDGKLVPYLDKVQEVHLYDINPEFYESIKQANPERSIRYFHAASDLPSNNYDAIACSMVVMCIDSQAGLEDCFQQMHRVARPGALLVVTVTHPCFRDKAFSYFRTSCFGREYPYRTEGWPFEVHVDGPDGPITFTDHHWSLGFMLELIARTGWRLASLEELPDVPFRSNVNEEHPPYLILTFNKPHA